MCSSVDDAMLKHFLNLKIFLYIIGQILCHHLNNDWSLCERLSECIQAVDYFRKEHLKDKTGIRENQLIINLFLLCE